MHTTSATHIRVKPLAERLSVSVATLWRWAKTRPDFPKPIKLGPNTTVWSLAAVDAWMTSQAATSVGGI